MLGIMLAFDALHEALALHNLIETDHVAVSYQTRAKAVGDKAPTAKLILDVLAARLTSHAHQPLQELLNAKTMGST